MADAVLSELLAAERSQAIRLLLGSPLLDVHADPDDFRLVVRHAAWLTEWFDESCGWTVTVDPLAGFARLAKRCARPDTSRPLRRTRGSEQPFDRRRYQLLCLACAELVRHPVTTVGLLAGAVGSESGLDTSRHSERAAFVDALRALVAWGVLSVAGGEVDAFIDHETANALLTGDTARLYRLLVSAASPSLLAEDCSVETQISALLAEPRYDTAQDADGPGDELRLRWIRHTLARRVLDDPVVYFDDLSDAERDYLANPAGRRWLRTRVTDAGFELEERAEGLLAVDADGTATDQSFPAPHGNVHQLALLLIDILLSQADDAPGRRLGPEELHDQVRAVLDRFPGWARSHREGDGPDRLADEAVGLLVAFGLAQLADDGTVIARPAMARYRITAPAVQASDPTLFEVEP